VSPKLKQKPSDYWRQHGHASFQDDPVGIETRRWMGVETIMWGNDYPHLEGTWPHSEDVISRFGEGVTRDETAKIIGLNAARLFNIPVPERFRS
jgi:predicted TIM-barrel fold metal-dependent hydrolase